MDLKSKCNISTLKQQYSHEIIIVLDIIIIVLGLLSFPAFSPSSSLAHPSSSSIANGIDTFHARGTINDLIPGTLPNGITTNSALGSSMDIFVTSGNWALDVINGKVQDFLVKLTMVTIQGTELHTHILSNFKKYGTLPISSANSQSVSLNRNNNTLELSGTIEIQTNNITRSTNIPVSVSILNGNVIHITLIPPGSGPLTKFFKPQPFFGLVTSIVDQNNNELRSAQLQESS